VIHVSTISTGAEVRITGALATTVVVCLNGGRRRTVAGSWGATIEWLVRRLAPRLPEVSFAELRYRVGSWRRLDSCVEDARAAVEELPAERVVLVGFSMGGAVAIAAADAGPVEAVVGLAPWIPEQLDLVPLRGRELVVIHGALDRWLPGVPGVPARHSRRGFERARSLGIEGRYTLLPGALHGAALRAPGGRLVPLPQAERWAALLEAELRRLVA
jgi:dienelactone hydrolase